MKCPKCETENPSDSKYCKECSTPLPTSEEISVSQTKTLETPILLSAQAIHIVECPVDVPISSAFL